MEAFFGITFRAVILRYYSTARRITQSDKVGEKDLSCHVEFKVC
jgi:hypothetical protein